MRKRAREVEEAAHAAIALGRTAQPQQVEEAAARLGTALEQWERAYGEAEAAAQRAGAVRTIAIGHTTAWDAVTAVRALWERARLSSAPAHTPMSAMRDRAERLADEVVKQKCRNAIRAIIAEDATFAKGGPFSPISVKLRLEQDDFHYGTEYDTPDTIRIMVVFAGAQEHLDLRDRRSGITTLDVGHEVQARLADNGIEQRIMMQAWIDAKEADLSKFELVELTWE